MSIWMIYFIDALKEYLVSEATVDAEILFCLDVVLCKYSFHSSLHRDFHVEKQKPCILSSLA